VSAPSERIEPPAVGADVAPTRRAALREQSRHQVEEGFGRHAAGEAGRLRDQRAPGVTRADLAAAADAADIRVAGRPLPRRTRP
jgi:hypothetical protein